MNIQKRKAHEQNCGSYQQTRNMGLCYQSQLLEVGGCSTKLNPGSSYTSGIISSNFSLPAVSLFSATDEKCNGYSQGHSDDIDGSPTCSPVSRDHISTVPLYKSFSQDSKVFDKFDLQSLVKFHLQNNQNSNSSERIHQNSYGNSTGSGVIPFMQKSTEETTLKYVNISKLQNHKVSSNKFL